MVTKCLAAMHFRHARPFHSSFSTCTGGSQIRRSPPMSRRNSVSPTERAGDQGGMMPEKPDFSIAAQQPVEGKSGATAVFPYDRVTVERFRSAFPGARWRDDLRAWFVPGTTAERRLNRWLGRELSGVLGYADDRARRLRLPAHRKPLP